MFERGERYKHLASNPGLTVVDSEVFSKYLQFTSLQEFLEFWSGVSHGTFNLQDINQDKLQQFGVDYGDELLDAVINLPTLCMVMKK